MKGLAVTVDVSGEGGNSTFKVEGHFPGFTLVNQLNGDAASDERHLAETLDKRFKAEG